MVHGLFSGGVHEAIQFAHASTYASIHFPSPPPPARFVTESIARPVVHLPAPHDYSPGPLGLFLRLKDSFNPAISAALERGLKI